MTHDELNEVLRRAQDQRQSLQTELDTLDRAAAIKRLIKEPLIHRLYWYETLPGRKPKAEFNLLTEGIDDEAIVDARILLAKLARATSDAAHRHYQYPGHEALSWEENLSKMFVEASECPATLIMHSFDRALLNLR